MSAPACSEVDELVARFSPKAQRALLNYVARPCVAQLEEVLSRMVDYDFTWQLARVIAQSPGEESEIRAVIRTWLSGGFKCNSRGFEIGRFCMSLHEWIFVEEWEFLEAEAQSPFITKVLFDLSWKEVKFELTEEITASAPFRSAIANRLWSRFDFNAFRFVLGGSFARMVARFHPGYFDDLLNDLGDRVCNCDVLIIAEESQVLDAWYIDFAERDLTDTNQRSPMYWLKSRRDEFERLAAFNEMRNNLHLPLVMRMAVMPEYSNTPAAVGLRRGPPICHGSR
jgi:hypothetical protein